MPATEIAVFPLVPGSDIGNSDSAGGQVLKDTFDTLKARDGMQQIQFGTRVEDPTVMQLMINWETKQSHDDFIAADAYGPFMKKLAAILGGAPIYFCHADFKPEGSLNKAFSAPVTEIAVFGFEGGPPEDYLDNVAKLSEIFDEEKPDGYLGMSAGVTYEEIEKEGVKGKAAVVAIGWQSVDVHMAFRKTEAFSKNIHLLRSTAKSIDMKHVVFMQAL